MREREQAGRAGTDLPVVATEYSGWKGRCGGRSSLVENPLGDLFLAVLAPLPALGADDLVEVGVGHADAAEPDLGVVVVDLLQPGASGEVEEIGSGRALT